MCEQQLVEQCSPTLAGLKTGSLFSCPCQDQASLDDEIRSFNRRLAGKGLCVIPLRVQDGRALIYVFRPVRLKKDLASPRAQDILTRCGYSGSCGQCVHRLMCRLAEGDAFPHEIGLFLSYPPEDVQGFIENRPGTLKATGIWKVYHDVESAKETFARYRKCTDVYRAVYARGTSIEHLTVPERA